ncbi:MAG: hypothetical protein CR997_06820 [Acidobacteria bacterium]|nr:MAG: hypothetical protein CR997_06820 [Acidobacteriota bacterium]
MLLQYLNTTPLRKLFWLSPFLFALHNVEETLFIEKWSKGVGTFIHESVTTQQFGIAVSFLTILVLVLTIVFVNSEKDKIGAYVLTCIVISFLINAIFPHIVATVYFGSYSPGVVTSVFIYIPFSVYMLYRIFNEKYLTSKPKFAISVLGTVLIMKILIPISLCIGK